MNLKTGILLASLFYLVGCQEEAADTQRPNIIFLMADDQRADAFGFTGNEHVLTPNLDKLAADGVTFANAYHVAPICQPSRASVMTGQYLSTHQAGFDRPTNYVITVEEFQRSYPVQFREQGYFTGFIGKFGFAVGGDQKVKNDGFQDQQDYMPANYFDVWNGFPGQGSYVPEDNRFNGYENNTGATHLTEFMGDQAIAFLDKAQGAGKPFMLSISFKAPHAPFNPAKEFRKLYDNLYVPRMENDKPSHHALLPEVVQQKSRNARWYFGRSNDYYGNDVGYRRDWHIQVDSIYQAFIKNYYGLITGIDHAVGRIRAELDRRGLEENTIIIYTSDNGFFAGSKQLMGKALLYEESVKAPLFVYDPRLPVKQDVQTEQGLVSHVDIAPTLLDLAGLALPKLYPGKSFRPLIYNEKERIHEAVFGENNFDNFYPLRHETEAPDSYQSIRSRFVRTPEFKYIRYHENHPVTEELYAITKDPLETTNLINDRDYAGVADRLREQLDAFKDSVLKKQLESEPK